MDPSPTTRTGKRIVFSPRERASIQKLVIKYRLNTKHRDVISKRNGWASLAQEYNAIANNTRRTELQLKKCWDNMKSRKMAREREKGDSIMTVKAEEMPWSDSDSETTGTEVSTKPASLESILPTKFPAAGQSPVNGVSHPESLEDLAPDTLRMQEREEELHKLRVSERLWVIKTMKEQHATAQLQRERAELERERAQFERDKAQLDREKAQLELMRAKRVDSDLMYDK